jgi:hypothetical protein
MVPYVPYNWEYMHYKAKHGIVHSKLHVWHSSTISYLWYGTKPYYGTDLGRMANLK